MTSEEDLKFGEVEIHVERRDKEPKMLPGKFPTSPQAYDQSANVIAEFMSCLDLHNVLCESKVSLLQVQRL